MRSIVSVLAVVVALAAETHSQNGATTLDGSAPAAVFDLTAAGRLVGSITPADQAHAAFWRTADAAPLELPLLPGTNWGRAFGANARGEIVGLIQDRSVSPPVLYAAYWESEVALPIALAGGTSAVAINSVGQIVGNMSVGGSSHAALWNDAASPPIDLGTFGGTSSSAADLNDAGQIVGAARYADGAQRAAFWPSPGEPPIDLGIVAGATRSAATAINERGEIAGGAFFADTGRRVALFWPSAGADPIELPSLGGASSQAVGLDNRGRIVGQAQNAAGEMRACVWTSPFDPPIDLGPGFARAINARGIIAGEVEGNAAVWTAWR